MKVVELVEYNTPGVLFEVVKTLQKGGIVLYPTEMGYVLSGKVEPRTEKKIREMRGPLTGKGAFVSVADFKMLRKYAYVDLWTEGVLAELWPGLASVALFSRNDSGDAPAEKRVFRMTDSYFPHEVVRQARSPLFSVPATFEPGDAPALSPALFLERFHLPQKITPDLIVDAGLLPILKLSTTLDLTNSKNPILTRRGELSRKDLYKLLEII